MPGSRLTPIRIPEDLLTAIDQLMGPRKRSNFFVAAARKELTRIQQSEALKASAGVWQNENHPELPDTLDGLAAYLREARIQAEYGQP